MDHWSTRGRTPVLAMALAMLLSLLPGIAGPASGATPPPPPGKVVVAAGQPPRQCVAGDPFTNSYGINYGVYFSKTANAWLSAPWCYPRWGFLEASASGVVAPGQRFTVTAIPADGSNSGTYAPEARAISWTYPGTRVSGCGNADLTCTVIPATTAGEEWSWAGFQVSMPRTFFIDSPGEFCAGQHLCPGATTHAWAWVGVPPKAQQRHIRGVVHDAEGKPVSGVRISADGPGGGSDRTDAAGTYLIPVKKGTHTVSVTGDFCVVGKPDCTRSVKVTVPPSRQVDFEGVTETCPLNAPGAARRVKAGRHASARAAAKRRLVSPAADCLRVKVRAVAPHGKLATAGDRVRFIVTPSNKNPKGTVLLIVQPPDKDVVRLLPDTITSGYTRRGDTLEWKIPASSLHPVSFTVKIRSDAKLGDPWKDRPTFGVVATAYQGDLHTPSITSQLDLLPCGQQPADHPSGYRATAAAGWTFDVGVDPRFGLAVNDLRLDGIEGGGSRRIAPRISVPYLQVQTSETTATQYATQVRLRPSGNEAFARSTLLHLKLGGTTAEADEASVYAVYGIDHLGKGSASCLLIRVAYEFRRYATDVTCHPLAQIGFGDVRALKCAQFRPLLEYRFMGADGEKLRRIQTVQRLHANIDGIARSNAMVLDRDLPGLGNPVIEKAVNPINREGKYVAIRKGKAGLWDNFHQRPALNPVDVPADLTDGTVKACGDCFHLHWRWGRLAGGTLFNGLGGGRPIINEGSTQDADAHIIKPRAGEEGLTIQQLENSNRFAPDNPAADGDVALYWVSRNTQQHDSFFTAWAWAVPRNGAAAGVTTQSFAVRAPDTDGTSWFCSLGA